VTRLSRGNFVPSDRWLLDLVDAAGPLPDSLVALREAGVEWELTEVWCPYESRTRDGTWRERDRVDPRIARDLERLLRNVRLLHVKTAVTGAAELVDRFGADPLIRTADVVPRREFCGTARRARRDAGWHLDATRWHAARRLPEFRDAADIRIAVLDSGLDARHPDLRRLEPIAALDPFDHASRPPRDRLGHGTHTTAIVLGDRKTKFGLRGMCAARVEAHSIVDPVPTAADDPQRLDYVVDERRYLAGLVRAIESRVDIVHFGVATLGGPTFLDRALLELAQELAIVVVAPIGNYRSHDDPPTWAALRRDVIGVGASSIDDSLAPFSSRPADTTILAPGVAIWSAAPTYAGEVGFDLVRNAKGRLQRRARPRPQRVMSVDGTSAAAAQVTAAIALLLAARGKDSPSRVRETLQATAWRRKAARSRGDQTTAQLPGVLDVAALLAR
jgi:subtilisin family serine protease